MARSSKSRHSLGSPRACGDDVWSNRQIFPRNAGSPHTRGDLGIPFDQECASETIRADALFSKDGLARAIRLVY
jgi:hypothetical protein